MDTTKLMIGDWVLNTENGFMYQIKEFGTTFCTDEDDYLLFTKKLEPIPLTEEMLNDNGFSQSTNRYYKYSNDFGSALYDSANNLYHICGNVCIDGKITYVHELQHALRLCGLNELADNLVIPNSTPK